MEVLRHGVDLVLIDRIDEMLHEHGERFVERCFTSEERTYSEANPRGRAERYAARFACKEAVLKALGTGWRNGIAWTDVGVTRQPSGEPGIRLTGHCGERAADLGIREWRVSLSHAGAYAIASVIGLG